jgi:hypothetical protein
MAKRYLFCSMMFVITTVCSMFAMADEATRGKEQAAPAVSQKDEEKKPDCGCQSHRPGAERQDVKDSYNDCVCDKYPVYDLGGGEWLFYANEFSPCTSCANPTAVWDVESAPFHTADCPPCLVAEERVIPGQPVLASRLPYNCTMAQFADGLYRQRIHSPDSMFDTMPLDHKVEAEGKTIMFPINGAPRYARLFLLSVKPNDHELIVSGLGVETEAPSSSSPADFYYVSHVKPHVGPNGGWMHAFDVQIGPVTYVVIMTAP